MKDFTETGDSRYIYQIEVDKSWFQHYTVYDDFNDLPRKQLLIKENVTELGALL